MSLIDDYEFRISSGSRGPAGKFPLAMLAHIAIAGVLWWLTTLLLVGTFFSFSFKSSFRLFLETTAIIFIPLLISGLYLLMVRFVARLMPRPYRGPTAFCRTCGYDLRATPLRCPECGRRNEQRALSTDRKTSAAPLPQTESPGTDLRSVLR